MENSTTVSTNPKDYQGNKPKPKDGETGGIPLHQPRPKVGDRLQFAGGMWVIRKITKKDILLRPWHGK